MKKVTYFLCVILLGIFLYPPLLKAQNKTSGGIYDGAYPEKYTFEKAEAFEKNGEHSKAAWFYINLLNENKEKVITKVKLINKPDTISLKKFIELSFAMYSVFDPTISTYKDGQFLIDEEKLNAKGDMGDYLVAMVVSPNDTMLSANQLSLRAEDECDKFNYPAAVKDYTCAIHLDPKAKYYFFRAFAESATNDYINAMPDYDKCVEMKYHLSETYFERGYAYEDQKKYDEAIEDFSSSINEDNSQKVTYYNRGACYYLKNEFKKAIRDFDKAIELDPYYAKSYGYRGLAKEKLNDKQGACKDFEKAAELGDQEAKEYMNSHCN